MPSEKTGLCEGTPSDYDNRKKNVFQLISSSRTCLVSVECLEILLSHPLVNKNKKAREVINGALLYQLQTSKRNGQWSSGATHRNNSELENVAVMLDIDFELIVYSFSKNKWYRYNSDPPCDLNMKVQMIPFDQTLYCLCIEENHFIEEDKGTLLVYHLTGADEWSDVNYSLNLRFDVFSAVYVDDFIYIVQLNKFWKLNPFLQTVVSLNDLPDDHLVDNHIRHLTCYDKNILAFYSVPTESGVDETGVLCFDTSNNTWTLLNNLEGPAEGMTSFKDDHSTYLLQSNGDMWKIVKPQSNVVDFEFVVSLWRCDWPLHGAVIFLDKLYLQGVRSETLNEDPQLRKFVEGLIHQIVYLKSSGIGIGAAKFKFIPFIAK